MLNFILVHSMIYLFILCSNIFVKAIFKRCLESHCYLIHPLPFVMSVDRINRIALYTTHSVRRDFLPFLDYVHTVTFPNISNMLFQFCMHRMQIFVSTKIPSLTAPYHRLFSTRLSHYLSTSFLKCPLFIIYSIYFIRLRVYTA
jgi:hypothetical protein